MTNALAVVARNTTLSRDPFWSGRVGHNRPSLLKERHPREVEHFLADQAHLFLNHPMFLSWSRVFASIPVGGFREAH